MPKVDSIKRKDFEKFLVYVGGYYDRQKGDYIIYKRIGIKRPIVFQAKEEVPMFIVRNSLRVLGISVQDFLNILENL